MEALLAIVGNVWTGVTDLVGVVKAEPIMLFPIAFVFAGSVVGLTKSLLGLRRRRRG